MTRVPAPRYGIAEWFGYDITKMSAEQRLSFTQLAIAQDDNGDLSNAPICPYLSTLVPGAQCNKASGVCSIRRFSAGENGAGIPVENEKIVTLCPSRFLQKLENGKSLFSWISEKMLDIPHPTIVKETPFLRKISDVIAGQEAEDEEDGEGKKAGRIDWIIVNPETMSKYELDWCAIETQALYFSGKKMRLEFDAYLKNAETTLYPVAHRRPDYRSSGPKRLSPQLDVKVPVLRNWGKKVVVVIDRFFYDNMNSLADAFPRAKNDKERRDNADVVWFVVDYNDQNQLKESVVIYTTLDSSRRALNATEPLSKSDFTINLKSVISDKSRANKVFKASE